MFDMTVPLTLANVLTIIVIIGSVFGAVLKFNNDINKKADKSLADRINENLQILSGKIDVTNSKLEKIASELQEYKESFHQLEKEFLVMNAEHKKNH